jgi:palmitoyl-protein thioesterase
MVTWQGLLMRSLAQVLPRGVNMDRLITLAGVNAGYYGSPFAIPVIGKQLPLDVVTDIFYTGVAQHEFSVAGFWRDPFNSERYLAHCSYLPWINNELAAHFNLTFRSNFLSLRDAHCFGSPEDGDVVPWTTEIWGFYKEGSDSELVPMNETAIYQKDTFGLRSLDARGDLHLHVVNGVQHSHWLRNQTNFVANVLPLLD